MNRFNKNETRLLAILGSVIFFALTILLVKVGLHSLAKDRQQVVQLKSQYESYVHLQQQTSYWQARKEWLNKHPLPTYNASKSDSEFVERIQKSLTAAGLKIEEQHINKSIPKDAFMVTVLTIQITGDLENLVRWMATTQKTGDYLSISKLILKADPNTMFATVELSQFFSTP